MGVTKKEAEAFLVLLPLGAQPVSVFARHINIPRSSAYVLIERLKKAGIIEEFSRASITYVKCIPVENLIIILKRKQEKIEQNIHEVEDIIPQLKKLENTLSITPKVLFYEGQDEVSKMYTKILQEKSVCAFANLEKMKLCMGQEIETIPENIKKYKKNAREILMNNNESHQYKKKHESDRHQIKLYSGEKKFSSDTLITADRIFMVSYSDTQISAVEIYNPELANTQQIFFDSLWNTL